MIRVVLALLLALSPVLATAQEAVPSFHDVTGVNEGDVLNIREAPGVGSAIIGTLSPGQTDIEVVALDPDGEWGQVNTGERSGWVAMRYLACQPGQPGNALPRPLQCFGTEPFWSLNLSRDPVAEFLRPAEDPVAFSNLYSVDSSNRTDRYAIFGQGDDSVLTAVFHRAACSDLMSDRAYGIGVDLFLTDKAGVSFMSGCCQLVR